MRKAIRNLNIGNRTLRLLIPKQELSFCVSEQCNLSCSYCYQINKNTGKKMGFSTAKKAIDYFLNNKHFFTAQQLVIDFIGGEPLLEAELMDQIMDYFKVETYRLNHPWFNNYKIVFTTNGTIYHKENVQKFVHKNKNCLLPAISLDGIEEKHNNARKYSNGKGSYKDVIKNARLMLKQLPYSTVKATFGIGDIKYFKDSIIHFLEVGFPLHNIFANVAYEDLWEESDDLLFEKQLIELADYLVDNDICFSNNSGSIFSTHIGKPYTYEHLSKHWCNAGHGILVGVEGSFYPCLRFLEMSFDDKLLARKIGDIHRGIDFDKLRPFRVLTLENCSPKKCLECDVASGCNMCSGQALEESKIGTIFHRPTYICKMHKARVRANNYLWKKLAQKEKLDLEKHAYIRKSKTKSKKILNVLLSTDTTAICNYEVQEILNNRDNQILERDTLENYLELARKANYYVNYILPNHEIYEIYKSIIDNTKFQVTRPYKNESSIYKLADGEIFVFDLGQQISSGFSCANVIVHLKKDHLELMKDYICKLFSHGIMRINLLLNDLCQWEESDFKLYKQELNDISDYIYNLYKQKKQKSLNVLTDRLFLSKMNNCNAGLEHITLGPDGKVYLCPAFYYKSQPLESDDLKIPAAVSSLLKLENAPICQLCDAYQCQRCFFRNKEQTSELNIPGEKQCIISHLEREVSRQLQKRLFESRLIPFPNRNIIPALNYQDPLEVAKVW